MARAVFVINTETGGQVGRAQEASRSIRALTETLPSATWEAGQRVSGSAKVRRKT